ncbi:hypothetical protein I5M27_02110 [Adhaeribacter sp. BT258]|uniref:Lipoprotein n=1 Tax=Adhaeribacter terrigena TaxID=2793070 RepID=A0ABS1BXF3_9BACT|nr:hypothetical protein [Adhaeribacter terrigena]MBK0401760.1 hypothetical protein [Adhaeribacter terrigena]
MKLFATRTLQVMILLFIGNILGGCLRQDCDPQKKPLLSVTERSFIPNQPGDSLHFLDDAGNKYFLVCKNKEISPVTYVPLGHENTPCESIYETWDKVTAHFEGNITNDQNQPISLEARIESGDNPNDPEFNRPCKSNYKCSFYLFFKISQQFNNEQIYLGKTEESLYPIIGNFNFIPQISFNGQQFHKLNTASISDRCSSYKPYQGGSINSPLGLDSVYYSAVHGLVRLTTVSGKKYQRVL